MVLKIIEQVFKKKPVKVEPIGNGVTSKAYSFKIKNLEYVFRIAESQNGYKKEESLFKLITYFDKTAPRIYKVGQIGKKFFSISKRCKGVMADKIDFNNPDKLMLNFVKKVYSYHTLSLKNTAGYGNINLDGIGLNNNWGEYILEQKQFVSEYWDKDYFDFCRSKIQTIIKKLPNTRSLIHGDLGFNNVLVDKNKITGIIDWNDAKFGDFVYDIAYVSFWSKRTDYSKLFYEYYKTQGGLDLNNFRTRMGCYSIHIGLNLLNFFAKINDKKMFDFVKLRLGTCVATYLD